MGMVIDHTHSRWGKCRPYFIWGAIPFAIIAILAFTVPPFGMTGKIIYAYITYILLSTAYTLVNVPLSAILPSLTSDLQERNVLVSVRLVFSVIAGTIVTSLTLPLVNTLGGGNQGKGYFMTVLVFAIVSIFAFLFTFKNTKEVVHASDEKEKASLKDFVSSLNPQWLIFMGVTFLLFVAFMCRASSIAYYFQYNLNRVDLMPVVGITIATLGFNLVMSCRFAISPDIIDYGEYKSGVRTARMLCATEGFVAKLAMGVSGSLIAGMLSWGGYVANVQQISKALLSIQAGFLWVPVLAAVLMIVCMLMFKVEKEMPNIQKVLEERREKYVAAAN